MEAAAPTAIFGGYDFSGTHIIKPPREADAKSQTENRRVTRLYIDSRDRNASIHPSPSCYSVPLDEDVFDVVSVDLVDARIPFVDRNVSFAKDTLHVQTNGAVFTASIPTGKYDGPALAAVLQASLIATTGAPAFRVAWDATQHRFSFSADRAFSIMCASLPRPYGPQYIDKVVREDGSVEEVRTGQTTVGYPDRSIGQTLGFGRATYPASGDGTGGYVLHAPYVANLDAAEPIFMFMDAMSVNSSINDRVNKCFAILFKDGDVCKSASIESVFRKTFWPPLAKLSQIRVAFKDYTGAPADFQNREHNFQLLVTSLRQNRGYQSFMTLPSQ